jgi:phosphinothricin acetyltransferase
MSSPAEPRPQLSLRPANEEDAAGMREIFAEGVQDHLIPFEDHARSRDEITVQIAASLVDTRQPILVAELRGWLLGWAALAPAYSRAKLADIAEVFVYVRRSFRNYGVGQQLMRGIQDQAKLLGYRKLLGHILADNGDSLRLCQTTGWREVGRQVAQDPSFEQFRDVIVVEYSFPSENDPAD